MARSGHKWPSHYVPRDCVLTPSSHSRRPARLAAEYVMSEMAVCWELAAFTGSLRMLASVAKGLSETARQLQPTFRTPFLYIVPHDHSAGVRWQLGTETWESLPSLNIGGQFSGNVEILVSNGNLYVLAEAIKFGNKECFLQVFDPVRWRWSLLVHVPSGECETLLELNDHLYIVGRSMAGVGSWSPELWRYDPRQRQAGCHNQIEKLPAVLTPRCYAGVGAVAGGLYAVGGYAANLPSVGPAHALAVAERFVPGIDPECVERWESLPPMSCPRFLCKALAMKGCLYVLGGLNTGGIETAVERFDPSTDSWSTLAPMPAIKGSMDIVEHAGRIIVFGGADLKCKRQPEVIKYDPLSNSWTRMPNIARGRADLESAALVGPPENLLSVFSERISMRETNLVIQRYQDKRHDTSSSWRVPAYKGRLRAVMALDRE